MPTNSPGSLQDYMAQAQTWATQAVTDIPLASNNQKAQVEVAVANVYATLALVQAIQGRRM